MRHMIVIALVAACGVETRVPLPGIPVADEVYACDVDRDGETFTIDLCFDRAPAELEEAIVYNEPRVTDARCNPHPVASCLYSCPAANTGCNADGGCYCKDAP